MMRQTFEHLVELIANELHGDERFTASFAGERSHFVRFNAGLVRQPIHVRQASLTLRLLRGMRQCSRQLTVGAPDDAARVREALQALRQILDASPADPHLVFKADVDSSDEVHDHAMPELGALLESVRGATQGLDLVGHLALGPIYRGFASSTGQRNWYEQSSFNFDWSLVHREDKAVKASYAGFEWRQEEFLARLEKAKGDLDCLQRPSKQIQPGAYRAYLGPAALAEIFGLLGWEAFGLKAQRTRQSSLVGMLTGEAELAPSVTVAEKAFGPGFNEDGFLRPERVGLIEGGALTGSLVSARSGREYDVPPNGGAGDESPTGLFMEPGSLASDEILPALDTGVYINNLWYLNHSDRRHCRITGMTRFGTFWVEGGEVVAPLEVMRFDESLYRMLGSELQGLSQDVELMLDPDTYGGRSTGCVSLPGALVGKLTFTL